jgi:putative transposase
MMQREGFSISVACQDAGVGRAGFYRDFAVREPLQADTELRDILQRIVLQKRAYGYRRVGMELDKLGRRENHKRVLRLMREDNLLALRKRRFVLTTDSRHPFVVYPNVAATLQLNGIDQLWVADITYIRLREEFVYLAVVLDAYSRRVVGWELGEKLDTQLTMRALQQALEERKPLPGAVHHSDRGLQYCANDYVALLERHGFVISMSRKARPYDNAKAESFMKTLKCEEVYLHHYRNVREARASISVFINEVYNLDRLHSALQYRSPVEFERSLGDRPRAAGSKGGR